MEITFEDIQKLLLSILLGGIVGAEREYRAKAAGLRTMMLISLGCTLITIVSSKIMDPGDTRIVANILTGIGFLGAGVIFKDHNRVSGITTAATIWISATLGICIGSGYYALSILTTGIVLLILLVFMLMEQFIDKKTETRSYVITFVASDSHSVELETLFKTLDLQPVITQRNYIQGEYIITWQTRGKPLNHTKALSQLISKPFIKAIEN